MKSRVLMAWALAVMAAGWTIAGEPKALCKTQKSHSGNEKKDVVATAELKKAKQIERRKTIEYKKKWRIKADKDKDGVVSPMEAGKARTDLYLKTRSDVDRPWEKIADGNADGKVDAKELRTYHMKVMDGDGNGKITAEERKRYWVEKHAVVDTVVEKKYDANKDGYLTWDEGREMMKDRARIIETEGRALVTSELEMEFDANADGIIDRTEAPALMDAFKN